MFSTKDVACGPMDSHVTNKILEIYGLPSFLRHGAPLVRLRRAGAPLVSAGMIAVRIFFKPFAVVEAPPSAPRRRFGCGHRRHFFLCRFRRVPPHLYIWLRSVTACLKDFKLQRFSFECRKVIGFTFATLHDWLKKFAPIFHQGA